MEREREEEDTMAGKKVGKMKGRKEGREWWMKLGEKKERKKNRIYKGKKGRK